MEKMVRHIPMRAKLTRLAQAAAGGAAVAGLFLAAAPAPAVASTELAATGLATQVFVANNQLNVVAQPGVNNTIVVSLPPTRTLPGGLAGTQLAPGNEYAVSDTTGTVQAGAGCRTFLNTVRCPTTDAPRIEVVTGDGSDSVLITAPRPAVVAGGSGPDVIEIRHDASVANQLTGGAGNDTLIGGPGQDTIDGGPGNDFINGGGGGPDELLGGNDQDTIIDGDFLVPDSADTLHGGPGVDVCSGIDALDPRYGTDTYISCESGGPGTL